tara:strand:+ start:2576 stop:3424 length:849 start_codon:yes stop_codon:yes gene_type:complete
MIKKLSCSNPNCSNAKSRPLSDFYVRKDRKRGYSSLCKDCIGKQKSLHYNKIRHTKIKKNTEAKETLLDNGLWACTHPTCESLKKAQIVNNFRVKRINAKTGKITYQSWCRKCERKSLDLTRKINREWVNSYLSLHACAWCGHDNADALVFHHAKKEKYKSISDMISSESIDAIKREIAKCIILCANCHMKHHSGNMLKKNTFILNPVIRQIDKEAKIFGCQTCSLKDPDVLCYHHRNPKNKKYNVSNLINHNYKIQTLIEEMAKCDILCHNCHMILHKEES